MVSKRESTSNETLNEILNKGKTPDACPSSEAAFDAVEPPTEDAFRTHDADPPALRSELLKGVHLSVRAELGRRCMPLKDALRLDAGSIIDLEKRGDDPVNLYVNDLLLARGVVMVVDDRFCLRITEVLPPT